MELHPAQKKIAEDTHRFRVLVCGRKFGKTSLSAYELIGVALGGSGRRVMYVAPTLGDARRLMWDRIKQILGRAVVKENDTRLELDVATPYGGTSKIFLGSWELFENYRGDEFDFLLFDETQEYRNFLVGWQEALRPTLTPRKGAALFVGTPKGFNHFYDLYNAEYEDKDFKSFKFSSYENPHIDPKEIGVAKDQMTEDRFAQEYLAEFRKAEGLVFKEFKREIHVFDGPLYGWSESLAGVDWGYKNPAAVPSVKMKEGAYYVTDMLYRTRMTDDEVADYVAGERFNKVYPDPENPSAISLLKKRGVNVRDVKKGRGSIEAGIDKIRELFKQNKLFIHKSCVSLIAELEMYSYADKQVNHNEKEKPMDEYNHAIDALRYVVSTHIIPRPLPARPFTDKMKLVWQGR